MNIGSAFQCVRGRTDADGGDDFSGADSDTPPPPPFSSGGSTLSSWASSATTEGRKIIEEALMLLPASPWAASALGISSSSSTLTNTNHHSAARAQCAHRARIHVHVPLIPEEDGRTSNEETTWIFCAHGPSASGPPLPARLPSPLSTCKRFGSSCSRNP